MEFSTLVVLRINIIGGGEAENAKFDRLYIRVGCSVGTSGMSLTTELLVVL